MVLSLSLPERESSLGGEPSGPSVDTKFCVGTETFLLEVSDPTGPRCVSVNTPQRLRGKFR